MPLFAALVPTHALALFIFMTFQIVRNVIGHAGVEVHPAAMTRSRLLGWNNTTTHRTSIIRPAAIISDSISVGGIASWAPNIRSICRGSTR